LRGDEVLKGSVRNSFRNRLIQLREELGLTQKQFANAIKMPNATINRYETGIREPDFDTLIIFADFFNVNTDFLLGRTEVKGRY
jgi:transcriptional regulator with XRE-family HTH domain